MSDDDSSTTFELTRRRILGGAVTIGAASAATGAGTLALFSDTEQSSGNTVQAGTLDLSNPGDNKISVSSSGLQPGNSKSATVTLTNNGSLNGDHVEIGTSTSENDRGSTPSEFTTNKTASQVAKQIQVDAAYPRSNPFYVHAQLAGSYVYDVDGNGKDIDVRRENSDSGVGSGFIHMVSDGSVSDTAKSMVDVSGEGFTVNDLAGGTFSYNYEAGPGNEVNAPDEVELVLEDSDGIHFVFHQAGSNSTESTSGTRKVHDELTDASSANASNGWKEVDLSAPQTVGKPGNPSAGGSIEDLTSVYGDATVKRVGVRAGGFSNSAVVNMYYGGLTLSDGSNPINPNFRVRPTSVRDLEKATLDNLTGLSSSGGSRDLDVEFTLDESVGNEFQGDGIDIALEFGLAQEPGQDVL